MAALRRLGEDIDIAMRELALGTVSRFLRAEVVKELQRLRCLSASDFLLLERVSLTEVSSYNLPYDVLLLSVKRRGEFVYVILVAEVVKGRSKL